MSEEVILGRKDLVADVVRNVKAQRIATGKIDGVRVVLGLGYRDEIKIHGWVVWAEGTYGGRGQRGEEVFGERDKAEEYFEALVEKYGLKELKV
jgi:hypothetical protein